MAEPGIDAVSTVTRDENERNISLDEDFRQRINLFAADINIKNSRLDVIGSGGDHGLVEAIVRTVDLVAELRKQIGQHHRHGRLVFDEQDELPQSVRYGVDWRLGDGLASALPFIVVRDRQLAVQSMGMPAKVYDPSQLMFDASREDTRAVTALLRRAYCWAARFDPIEPDSLRQQFPVQVYAAGICR